MKLSPEELARFESKYEPCPTTGCWLWTGTLFTSGYGEFYLHGKNIPAHRLSWELNKGPIPEGLWILHHCDVRPCINPGHLFTGTHTDNMVDMVKKGRRPEIVGERHGSAKLTVEQVRKIRASKESDIALGEHYGICDSTVWRIRARRIWRCI